MIEITIAANGEPTAGMQLVSPAVYLDHWALRAVSEDATLGGRLTKVLEAQGGTLVLSWANIAEFPGLDEQAARKAEHFIGGQLPRLFFLPLEVLIPFSPELRGLPNEPNRSRTYVSRGVFELPPKLYAPDSG